MSNDITTYIHEYRGTVISLWQSLAHYKTQEYDWDLCDGFADICERLFFLIPESVKQQAKLKVKQRQNLLGCSILHKNTALRMDSTR